jgi:ribosomal protein L11 methylase PrmA
VAVFVATGRIVGDSPGLKMSEGEGAGFSWGGVVELKVVCVDDGSGTGICPDTLSDLLVEMGALSASVEDADYGTPDESPIFDEPGEQVWRAMRDQVKLWKRSRVTALFSSDEDIDNILKIVKESFELDDVLASSLLLHSANPAHHRTMRLQI